MVGVPLTPHCTLRACISSASCDPAGLGRNAWPGCKGLQEEERRRHGSGMPPMPHARRCALVRGMHTPTPLHRHPPVQHGPTPPCKANHQWEDQRISWAPLDTQRISGRARNFVASVALPALVPATASLQPGTGGALRRLRTRAREIGANGGRRAPPASLTGSSYSAVCCLVPTWAFEPGSGAPELVRAVPSHDGPRLCGCRPGWRTPPAGGVRGRRAGPHQVLGLKGGRLARRFLLKAPPARRRRPGGAPRPLRCTPPPPATCRRAQLGVAAQQHRGLKTASTFCKDQQQACLQDNEWFAVLLGSVRR